MAHETYLGLRSSYVATCIEVTRSKLLGSSVQSIRMPLLLQNTDGVFGGTRGTRKAELCLARGE